MQKPNLNKTVGSYLREARIKQSINLEQVSAETKISPRILQDLEQDKYDVFESDVYIKGLIRNYAKYLSLNPDHLVALYNRDHIVNESKKNVPDSVSKTFNNRIVGIAIVFSIISFTLGMFIGIIERSLEPPELELIEPFAIQAPFEGDVDQFNNKTIILFGKTAKTAAITINDEPIPLTNAGYFESEPLPLISDNNIIEIVAENQLGRTSTIILRIPHITVEPTNTVTNVVVTTTESTFLLIRADGIIVFNDTTGKNETISFDALNNFEVETRNPSETIVIFDNNQIRMEENDQVFQLED